MILQSFGNRVKALRQETGLSQERFALIVGLDRTYISSVESGKRNISLINIEKIAHGLNIKINTIFEGID
ncbi:MAG: XRE family transcriptional regulator [Bacteroidia bacterium]|nr:XRE family transcriptional regulator [Bacteroidia bacterium]